MHSGQRHWFWRLGLLAPFLSVLLGCATDRKCINTALLVNSEPAAHVGDAVTHYVVHSPDVLNLSVKGHPQWSGTRIVTPDGRIALTEQTTLRVEGQTTAEIIELLARLAAVAPAEVSVRVAEFKSQQLFVFSDVPGLQQVVAYQGPETIVDLLQRVGGLSSRCAASEIQVVRPHVADGSPPEIFFVDLDAILLQHDQQSNLTLQSFDQIYFGQSRQSTVLSCFPMWLQPFYKKLCGMTRREKANQQTKDLLRSEQPSSNSSL